MSKAKPNKKKWQVVRTDALSSTRMDKRIKEKVAGSALAFATPLITGGLVMLASHTLGCIAMGVGLAIAWFVITWMEWFPFLSRKSIQYLGYGVIVVASLALLCLSPDKSDATQAVQPITTTVQDSPGSTVVNVGDGGTATVNQSDPQKVDAIHEELARLRAWVERSAASEMWRLKKEYDLGFVLIAFSGETDAKEVQPYSDAIDGDWNNFKVHKDEQGLLWIDIPYLYIRPHGTMTFNGCSAIIPAVPGMKRPCMRNADIGVWVECLKSDLVGICAAIGFKKETAPAE